MLLPVIQHHFVLMSPKSPRNNVAMTTLEPLATECVLLEPRHKRSQKSFTPCLLASHCLLTTVYNWPSQTAIGSLIWVISWGKSCCSVWLSLGLNFQAIQSAGGWSTSVNAEIQQQGISKGNNAKGKQEVRGNYAKQSSGAGTDQRTQHHLLLDWRHCQLFKVSRLMIGCSQAPAQVSLMRMTDGEREREWVSVGEKENKNMAPDALETQEHGHEGSVVPPPFPLFNMALCSWFGHQVFFGL